MEKNFNMGVVIPHKLRNGSKCTEDFLCDGCDKLVYQNEELSANLSERKGQAPNEFGHMPHWYITT